MTDYAKLVGLRIWLRRTVDRPCAVCGESVVVIGLGADQHTAGLHCAGCERHRGWLPRVIADFLMGLIAKFGTPPATITVLNTKPIAGLGAPVVVNSLRPGDEKETANVKC